MTTDQKAQLATELLNAFTPSLIASFIFGLIVGVFFFSNLMTRLDRLSELYRRPKRIRFANLNGRIERNRLRILIFLSRSLLHKRSISVFKT